MDQGTFKKLNPLHVIFLVQGVMVGEGLLKLPHLLSPAGYNQWYLPLLLGAVAQLTLIPMIRLCQRYPEDNLFAINQKLMGKWAGKTVNALLTVYGFMVLHMICANYLRLVQTTLLTHRTVTLPLLMLFLVLVYIVWGGIKSIARFCILSFVLTGWMVLYLPGGLQKGEWLHLLPLANVPWPKMQQALHQSYETMLGYELILFYFPYIIHREKALKHASTGIWLAAFLYFLVSFTSVVYFSEWQLKNLNYPVLHLFQSVELSFITRIESLGIGLWLFLILSTAAAYLWMVKKGIDSLRSTNRISHLWLSAAAAWMLIQLFGFEWTTDTLSRTLILTGYGLILWPGFLLLLAALRNRRRG